MTHTPGPWKAVGQSVYAQTPQDVDHSRYFGYSERGHHGFLIAESIPHEATCRLIAASTDMIDALMQWQWAEANGDEEELNNARISRDAAIAKARGE